MRKAKQIKYKGGYKYQLDETHSCYIKIRPITLVKSDYISLDEHGLLVIKKGYCWDGPSGPTFDTKNFMRGSLIHDACYQLMREGRLSYSCRESADKELRRICRDDGMSRIRAWWVYHGA